MVQLRHPFMPASSRFSPVQLPFRFISNHCRTCQSRPPPPLLFRLHANSHVRTEAGADALLVTALDEVAWLLNARGSDVSYNPIFVAYALVTKDTAALYVDASKVCRNDRRV